MPVVHSSANVLSTDGVLSGQGPSSNVSTTSLSRRKSSCLKCSKPKPGPPVVSIATTRDTPSAFGLAQGSLATAGVGAGAGVSIVAAAPGVAGETAEGAGAEAAAGGVAGAAVGVGGAISARGSV